jgi:hypothetical protein
MNREYFHLLIVPTQLAALDSLVPYTGVGFQLSKVLSYRGQRPGLTRPNKMP